MKLFATSAYERHACLDNLRQLATVDTHENHSLVKEAQYADAILFVEDTHFDDLQFSQVQQHPLTLACPNKVFMYNEMDQAWPVLRGLYCSLSNKLIDPEQHIAFSYLSTTNHDVASIHASSVNRQWLYSFVGSMSHPIRRKLLSLKADDAQILDTSDFCAWNPDQKLANMYQSLYTQTMAVSKFVLCPHGIGPSSLRLFETMEAGRVPVIISDCWSAPPQIDWDFAVRIPEAEIASIPQVLRQLEPQWQSRSQAARIAWETAFSSENMFDSVGNAISELSQTAVTSSTSLAVQLHKYQVLTRYGFRNAVQQIAWRSAFHSSAKEATQKELGV
ncbi:glycosyltransferase family 47 protein [Granulosicoccus sp.]|nr:glycosyltransferase family 47 protein [Granulosicoccus sp.]